MTIAWDAVNARSRGLMTRLLDRSQLESLTRSADPDALSAQLLRMTGGSARQPTSVDSLVHRMNGDLLLALSRWATYHDQLSLLFEDEDRRNLRILLRGAAQGISPSARLTGLLATPSLRADVLRDLATAGSVAEVVRRLSARSHPSSNFLREAIEREPSSLLAVEHALARCFAQRALALTRHRARPLRAYVRGTIDLENVWSLLMAGEAPSEEWAEPAFLSGGAALSRSHFIEVARAPSSTERRRAIATLFLGRPLAQAFADESAPVSTLEARVLAARIDEQRRRSRIAPNSAAPCLLYVLRLRAQAWNLRRIAWGKSMALPPAAIEAELVAS